MHQQKLVNVLIHSEDGDVLGDLPQIYTFFHEIE